MSERIRKILARKDSKTEKPEQKASNTFQKNCPKEVYQIRQSLEKQLGKCNISQRKKMFLCLKRDQRLRVFAYPSKYTILDRSAPIDTMTISREKASEFRETNQVALVTVGPKEIQKFMGYKEGDIEVNKYFIGSQCPKGIRMQRLNSWYTIRTVNKPTKATSQGERGAREYRHKDIFGDTSDITSSDESVKRQPRKKKRRVAYVSSSELSGRSSRSTSPSKIATSSPTRDRLHRRVKAIFGTISDTGSSDELVKPRKTLSGKKRKQSPSDFTSSRKRRRKSSEKTSDYSSVSSVGNKVGSLTSVCIVANTKNESESTEDVLPPSETKEKKQSIEHKPNTSKGASSEENKVGSLTPVCSDEEYTKKEIESTEDVLPPSETKEKKPSIEHKPNISKGTSSEGNKVGSLTPVCSDEEHTKKEGESTEDALPPSETKEKKQSIEHKPNTSKGASSEGNKVGSLTPVCSDEHTKKESESTEDALPPSETKEKKQSIENKPNISKGTSSEGKKVGSLTPVCSDEEHTKKESESTEDASPPSKTKGKKLSIEHKPSTSKGASTEGKKVGSLTPVCSDEENINKRRRSNEDTCTDPPSKRSNPGGPLKEKNQEE